MPTVTVPIYVSDEDYALYVTNKRELIDLARDCFKMKFEEIKQDNIKLSKEVNDEIKRQDLNELKAEMRQNGDDC